MNYAMIILTSLAVITGLFTLYLGIKSEIKKYTNDIVEDKIYFEKRFGKQDRQIAIITERTDTLIKNINIKFNDIVSLIRESNK